MNISHLCYKVSGKSSVSVNLILLTCAESAKYIKYISYIYFVKTNCCCIIFEPVLPGEVVTQAKQ